MSIFNRFREQARDPDDVIDELGRQLAGCAPEGFAMLWARCLMVGDPEVALFYRTGGGQPLEVNPTASNQAELVRKFAELWHSMKESEPEPWVSATISLSPDDDFDIQFTYKPIPDVEQFKKDWTVEHLRQDNGGGPPLPIPQELDTQLNQCMEELRVKTEAHDAAWRLGKAERWLVDQNRGGCIRFDFADGTSATAPMQVIGTLNPQNCTWLWAWANPSISEKLREHAMAVRRFGAEKGYRHLTTAKLRCDEDLAWRLTALATRLNEAQGAYRGAAGNAIVFMTFGSVTLRAN